MSLNSSFLDTSSTKIFLDGHTPPVFASEFTQLSKMERRVKCSLLETIVGVRAIDARRNTAGLTYPSLPSASFLNFAIACGWLSAPMSPPPLTVSRWRLSD